MYIKPLIITNVFLVAASIIGLLAVYHRELGLPTDSDLFLGMAVCICLLACYLVQRKQATRKDRSSVGISRKKLQRLQTANLKGFYAVVAIVAVVALTTRFVAPYTAGSWSVSQQIVSSAIAFILFVIIAWFAMQRKTSGTAVVSRFAIVMITLGFILFLAALFFKR